MHLLELAAIFLLAVVLLVPLFQRLKLGGVLGYLADSKATRRARYPCARVIAASSGTGIGCRRNAK